MKHFQTGLNGHFTPLIFAGVAVFAVSDCPHAVGAEPLIIMCELEDTLNAARAGPLQVTYAGGPEGELAVASEHVTFSVLASQTQRTGTADGAEVTVTAIQGSGETTSVMPDPQALLTCAASSVQPEFKDDADMLALSVMGCVPKTSPATSPVPVLASVTLGLIPTAGGAAPDVIVEIKRRYRDAALPSGGPLEIDTFPKNCKLAGN
jgi:hypothetical protein